MNIELKAGDSLNIPEGCKAVIKDNVVVFEKEFEEGDVLHSIHNEVMLIFKKSTSDTRFSSHYDSIGAGGDIWNIECFRYATEEEKQTLFDKMKEQGFKWNAEEKKVEKIRWRAKEGYGYFYIDNQGLKIAKNEECKFVDADRFAFGNYFRTQEQAEEAARRIKEALFKYHEEITCGLL